MDLNGLPEDTSRLCDPTAAPVFIKSSSSSWPRLSLLRRSLRITKATPARIIAPPTPTTTPIMVLRVEVLMPELPDDSSSSPPRPGAEVSAGLVSVETVVCSMTSPFSVLVWVIITTDSDSEVGSGLSVVGFASVVSGSEVGESSGVELVEDVDEVEVGVGSSSSSSSEVVVGVDSSLVVVGEGSDVVSGSSSSSSELVGDGVGDGDGVGSSSDVVASGDADGLAADADPLSASSSSSSRSCLRSWWWFCSRPEVTTASRAIVKINIEKADSHRIVGG